MAIERVLRDPQRQVFRWLSLGGCIQTQSATIFCVSVNFQALLIVLIFP